MEAVPPTYLRVLIEIPNVQTSHAVDGGKDGRMNGRPGDIVHIVAVVFERVQRLVLLDAPQFQRPVDRRGEKQVRKINGPVRIVTIQAADRSLVTFVSIDYAGSRSVTAR